jgi:hypothetical protein
MYIDLETWWTTKNNLFEFVMGIKNCFPNYENLW